MGTVVGALLPGNFSGYIGTGTNLKKKEKVRSEGDFIVIAYSHTRPPAS